MFIAIACLLVLLCAAFIVWPWFRKAEDNIPLSGEGLNKNLWQQQTEQLQAQLAQGEIEQATFDLLKLELDKRLLDDVSEEEPASQTNSQSSWLTLLVCLAVVIGVGAYTYAQWGAHKGNSLAQRYKAALSSEQPEIDKLLPLLAEMRSYGLERGDDGLEWLAMAAQAYMDLSHYRKAAETYDDLIKIYASDGAVLANAAQAHYLSSNRQFEGKPEQYVKQALLLDPNEPSALGFSGMVAFEAEDYPLAVKYWQRLLDNLPLSERSDSVIAGALVEAKRRAVADDVAVEAKDSSQEMAADSSIKLSVVVSPDINVPPASLVFVTARAVSGPPVPLAVKRTVVSQLPANFELTPADAMAPQFALKPGMAVVVKAKISLSGNAISQSGDIESATVEMVVGQSQPVQLTIDQVLP